MPSSASTHRLSLALFLLCAALSLVVLPAPCLAGKDHAWECDPGEFFDTGRSRCSDCPAGTFTGVSGATRCCTCCAGFYQDKSGKDSCKRCPQNKPYSVPGATSLSQCRSTSGGAVDFCYQHDKNTCPSTGGGNPSPRAEPPLSRRARADSCPFGWRRCPVWGARTRDGGQVFECVDVRHDLESCGGCVYEDSPMGERTAAGGRDCSAIPNVDEVRCERGECIIRQCSPGCYVTDDGDRCLPHIGGWDAPVYYGLGKRGG